MLEKYQNYNFLPGTSPVLQSMGKTQHSRQLICLLVSLVLVGQFFAAWRYCAFDVLLGKQYEYGANSTLGFGDIYAISTEGSSRRQSLLSAAALTKLDLHIPEQPRWDEADIVGIQASENSTVSRGSALAWLGHLNALEKFLDSGSETALIMEDDVDWDVRLRTQQIPQTAYAIRELLDSHEKGYYYGNTKLWDVIWLGHCGDFFDASTGLKIPSIKSFKDSAMPEIDDMHPWTKEFLRGIGAHESQQRLVHKSVRPLCTFAYAVTRDAAWRIVDEIAVREPTRDAGHSCEAYDVRMLEGCRDEGLKCITVNPELFHHTGVTSEIARFTLDKEDRNPEAERRASEPLTATNIRCSARSRKWKELQDSITDTGVESAELVKDLAGSSVDCYIDDL